MPPSYRLSFLNLLLVFGAQSANAHPPPSTTHGRETIKLNTGWRFLRSEFNVDGVIYDHRNDTPPTAEVLKPWVLPSANAFIIDPAHKHSRPARDPRTDLPYTNAAFDDSAWHPVTLPHDWGTQGPFYQGNGPDAKVLGPMGRLPVQGVGWYRRTINVTAEDSSVFLEVGGAQSYAIVWLNGQLVGGWPFGYSSFRLDLTPYLTPGNDHLLAIRLDNPVASSRFYPGGGIYRDVWLTKVPKIHVGQYGTFITSRDVSQKSAILDLAVKVDNKSPADAEVEVTTSIYTTATNGRSRRHVASFPEQTITIAAGSSTSFNSSVSLRRPQLWGPPPEQTPNLYTAITQISRRGQVLDSYNTDFGIREVVFDPNKGLSVNGKHTYIQGVNQHHDLGALGAAFNVRAAERQLEELQELGCNAIRMSHNPPATELLDLTDRMGFLVIDEINDMWERNKTVNDGHLYFADWHEPNLRSFIRRDRNHPSVIAWSYGNEVREQDNANGRGVIVSQMLLDMVHEEDPTRPGTNAQCCVGPENPTSGVPDIINLNYRGEGIGDRPAYASNQTTASTEAPQYPDFHATFPQKMLLGSEYAASLSTRGFYTFPVTDDSRGIIVSDTNGGNSTLRYVSSYDLYTTDAGSSPDRVFEIQDRYPYVAGGFIWSGWDYLGEPSPYLLSRSSLFGVIDLAGFKKDRYYLYQARWRPDLPFAHILPHWTWPERVGLVTPVHVHSSADEAELFVNGQSQGRLQRAAFEYRFRWDHVVYEPGEVRVVTYKNGREWARAAVHTAGHAVQLRLEADRNVIQGDGDDLSFISVTVVDEWGRKSPRAADLISFSVSGGGEIVATDNGDSRDDNVFPSTHRNAFHGHALAIVRAKRETPGPFNITAQAKGLESSSVTIVTR